jgi:Flp pilus assembly protein TadD
MNLPDDATAGKLAEAEQLKFEARHDEALALLEDLLVSDPDNVTALEEVADNELSLGHLDRAAAAAKHVLALNKESYTAHYITGFIASHEERWADSIASLKTANTMEPHNPEILRCLGWSLFNSGNDIQGVVTLERALNLEDANPLILCDLGVVYVKMNEFEKAKALLQRALEVDPANERASECLAMVERIAKHVKTGVGASKK